MAADEGTDTTAKPRVRSDAASRSPNGAQPPSPRASSAGRDVASSCSFASTVFRRYSSMSAGLLPGLHCASCLA
eukprot:6534107-Prymnesium_polylepis.1